MISLEGTPLWAFSIPLLTIKNPALPGFCVSCLDRLLFDLRFLVGNVLAHDGVELPDLHFFRHVALVLGGGVEMAGAGSRDEFDFVT